MAREEGHTFREQLHIFGPALLLTLLGFLAAYQFVDPAPPDHIRMATGQKEGAYHLFAQRYQEILAREGIRLELINTAGSVENIRLLEKGEVDIAFVQGGLAGLSSDDTLRSLGSFYYEPLWLFLRKELEITQLTGLEQRRIAVGPEGSGTRVLALQLLNDNALTEANVQLLSHGGRQAADALLQGAVDAAFFVASSHSPVVRALLDSDSIHLMNFQRADAYTRLHRYLSRVILPEGIVNLRRNLPTQRTQLLTATANIVSHQDLHPALVDLLIYAGGDIHGEGGWFEERGEFPTPDYADFPLSEEARQFHKRGPSFLQRYLPFWAATQLDRLKVMLLPLIALLFPLIKIMPPLYRWRMRARIYPWYRDMLAIDRRRHQSRSEIDQSLADLGDIEREVSKISVPLSFAEELYDLRLHISMVRERLEKRRNNGQS